MGSRFGDNNITEGVNDKFQMKLYLIRSFKKEESAKNTLKLIVMHYRFNSFSSFKIKEHNGKSPLNLAGVDTSRLDWVTYLLMYRTSSELIISVSLELALKLSINETIAIDRGRMKKYEERCENNRKSEGRSVTTPMDEKTLSLLFNLTYLASRSLSLNSNPS